MIETKLVRVKNERQADGMRTRGSRERGLPKVPQGATGSRDSISIPKSSLAA